ncbi:glycosyltransferase family 31 protein [Amniculicola lignicola CBS 123094]|uniref:N-acetylgalactosaminide beta-1,3-galactosyltransferase n=1 Tax=Amniculicola lignicola CBS 123094 TaxID=1392246 RepID=A0A6A5WLU7_9PLEO|nr:glycosyltransferase family 31 protein [Amniculicola lignicola CBS 123094]
MIALRRRLGYRLFSIDDVNTKRPRTRDFGYWVRRVAIALPIVLLINYFVIFQGAPFSSSSSSTSTSRPDSNPDHKPARIVNDREKLYGPENGPDFWNKTLSTKFWVKHSNSTLRNTTHAPDPCSAFPTHLLSSVQVILKVGIADDPLRASAQLATVIKCIPNVLIVTDNTHAYGSKHTAQDVIASLPPDTYLNDEDYDVYLTQQNQTVYGEQLSTSPAGWRLDKYKFLPAVEAAVKTNPTADWYVFLESDTYIFWDNMFRLLDTYDPYQPWYFGSPSPGRTYKDANGETKTVWFAYGGAGVVLSGRAASRLIYREEGAKNWYGKRVTEQYKRDIQNDCCGDSVLGYALHDKAGVHLSGLWPMFNPHPLYGIPFSKKYWCEPAVTLHKTLPEQFHKLWDWENKWDKDKGPVTYADIMTSFHRLGAFSRRDNWDNADFHGFNFENTNHPSHTSFEACALACHDHKKCIQFTYHGHHCYMSEHLRMGHPKDPDGDHSEQDRRYISGWDMDKIEKWVESMEGYCEGVHWVKPSSKRIF